MPSPIERGLAPDRRPTSDAGGLDTPAEPPRVDPMAGKLVTDTLDYDGGRAATVYVPPQPPESVVFAGDGQRIARWGAYLEAANVPSTLIVGVHGLTDEMARLHEYSPAFDADRFAAHEKFFVKDVPQWVRSRFEVSLPPARTAVFGVSAGGELALALGLRHPEVFGTILCGSPGGGYRPTGPLLGTSPRAYLVAGTLEPFFLHNAIRWARALRHAGGEVVMKERTAEHGDLLWRAEFPLMVAWAFGSASGSEEKSAEVRGHDGSAADVVPDPRAQR